MLQAVNVVALHRASVAIVGPEVTNLMAQLYRIIDQAMKDGYDLAKFDAEMNVEERLDDAFDNGFECGVEHAEEAICSKSWDQGYLEGVSDAQRRPEIAEETVTDIVNTMMAEAYGDEYDASLVTDSGDEQVQDEA